MTWDYGKEGQAFPVQSGEVWAVGRHTFICSDLMESTLIMDIIRRPHENRFPNLLYCDPPWNQSNANSFRTKAGLPRATYRWEELYLRIANIGHTLGIPIWVEGRHPNTAEGAKIGSIISRTLAERFESYFRVEIPIKYYRSHACGLYYAGTEAVPWDTVNALSQQDDEYTPGIVMRRHGSCGVVIDPCAGRGVTSREAQRSGWLSINNELHPARVSAALYRMRDLCGETPRRLL